MSLLTIGNVVSPHETNVSTTLKVCTKESTLRKKLDQFSISVVQECSAIKKGLLWEQQQNRFFFNRWKERFFILTQDYLTCFKKGSKKVGMSEMGSFVYKINLNDIKNLNWVDKKKNGVIGIQLANTMIFLWNNADSVLDDWMAVLQDSTIRTKDRREAGIRKSSTLLPNMITTQSKLINNADMNKRTDSPNLILPCNETPSDNGSAIIPPPPPPRRYLRCLSTDLGQTANVSADDPNNKVVITTPNLMRNSTVSGNLSHSPIVSSKTVYKTGKDPMRKCSDASTASSSHLASQSLRCKSSYSIQFSPLMTNSPTQLHQNHQRRLTAKRLSAFNSNHHQIESSANGVIGSNSSNNFFQSADSEFTFVNSHATKFKPLFPDIDSIINGTANKRDNFHATTTDRICNSAHVNGNIPNNRISSSASLMLNHNHHRTRNKDRFILDTPPPVPPHRTHLHHF